MSKSFDFSQCMDDCEVFDLGFICPKYTEYIRWMSMQENIEDDNNHQTAMPYLQEIKSVVFNMSASSAAGPDGYTGTFSINVGTSFKMT